MSEQWKSLRNWVLALGVPIGLFIWLIVRKDLYDTYMASGQPLTLKMVAILVDILPMLILTVIALVVILKPSKGG